MVANPARGQLNSRENIRFFLFPFAPENLVSRDRFGRLVPRGVYMYVWSSPRADEASNGMVANPVRGQLNSRENIRFFLFPFAPQNLVSRDRFGRPVPREVYMYVCLYGHHLEQIRHPTAYLPICSWSAE